MKTIYHNSSSRGLANHGWLKSKHTFSFADYYDATRMNFGMLRVLNDDQVAPGQGFPLHPHKNMEIISIPLMGDLEHMDSMGNHAVIKEGDIQVMSAGTGVRHSEYNKNNDQEVHFLQIWVIPKQMNVTPRYDQVSLNSIRKQNELYQVLSPNKDDKGVWINQNAWFYLGEYNDELNEIYKLNDKSNGVYLFVLEGEIIVNDQELSKRDGLGIWDTLEFSFKTTPNTRLLVMEVPMDNDINE